MKKTLLSISLFLSALLVFSQGRLVLNNGAYMVMQNGVYLVVDNPNANAITELGAGGNIVSENENNKVRWNIGTATGTYTIPFADNAGSGVAFGDNAQTVDAGDKIAYSFTIVTPGVGAAGFIDFSTFDGTSWDNQTYMPSMVTHMGQMLPPNVVNHSDFAIDRFWVINAQGYTTKPSGIHTFTYIDNELTAPGNNMLEANLGAQRFNDVSGLWGDMWSVVSSLNTASNVLVTPIIAASDFYAAWTLSDITDPLPVELLYFNADCQNDGTVKLTWATATEINNDYFAVQKSYDATDFMTIGTVAGNGNSNNIIQYEFIDQETGQAYYRLKQVDFNGDYQYSDMAVAACKSENFTIKAFDNYSGLSIQITSNFSDQLTVDVIDARGRLVAEKQVSVNEGFTQFEIENTLAKGIYFIRLTGHTINTSLKVFKQ